MPIPSRPEKISAAGLTLLAACLLAGYFLAGAALKANASESDRLWEALRSGTAFAIMRHALAPGTGDPADFALGDCTTQRNLSDGGRQQALRIGDRFRQHGIGQAAVFSSAWCRCRDTAELLGLGPVTTLPALNSFFRDPERRDPQTRRLKAWLAGHESDTPLLLVTHQVNITALTGRYTASGAIVVARRAADGEIVVLGTL